jgi:hypothetical protein
MVSVSGEVKKANGEMMGGTTVVFYPAEGEVTSHRTDDKGQFQASVAVGPAKIAVMDDKEAASLDMSPSAVNSKPKVVRIKPKYATPESSGLTCNVGQQKDKLVLVVD